MEAQSIHPSPITSIVHGVPITTSLVIAEGIGIKHKGVVCLIRQRRLDLEAFGRVAFEMHSLDLAGEARQVWIARLNERQATLILSSMPNSVRVQAFTQRLAKAFHELAMRQMKDDLTQLFAEANKSRQEPTSPMDPMLALMNRMVIAMETLAQRSIVAPDTSKAGRFSNILACCDSPPCHRLAGCA